MIFRRTVDLAGVVLALSAETPSQATCLDWHFGPLSDTHRAPDLAIDLRTSLPATRPTGPPSMRDGPILRWQELNAITLWHEGGLGAVLRDGTLAIGGDQDPDSEWRMVRQLVFSGLSWFLDRRNLLMLHGGLIGRDGHAALLLGATGRGKSTLAVAALQTGWEVLSDDLVIIERDEARPPQAFGVPKRPTVAQDVAAQLGLTLPPLPGDNRSRRMLPAQELTVGWRRVRAVVQLDHHSGDGELRRLSHQESLSALINAFLEAPRPEALRRQLGRLAALAAEPAFVLAHAADPAPRLDRAGELLTLMWQRVLGSDPGPR